MFTNVNYDGNNNIFCLGMHNMDTVYLEIFPSYAPATWKEWAIYWQHVGGASSFQSITPNLNAFDSSTLNDEEHKG
jgi:hypothetical protein